MPGFHIAQMNVGHAAHPLDDARMKDFMDNLDRINALAEASPGFVWRLKDESNNATNIKLTPDPSFIVNMSVWASVEALFRIRLPHRSHAVSGAAAGMVPAAHGPDPGDVVGSGRHDSHHGGRPGAARASRRRGADRLGVHLEAPLPVAGRGRAGGRHEARALLRRLDVRS